MPFTFGATPWLKKFFLGALAQPPQLPSLHASYLHVISPVTNRRTLRCHDGTHSVEVALSPSVVASLDADEEDTGITTKNLLGYLLAPVQVAISTDMTTFPPSATLLLKEARLFCDRQRQRPSGSLKNVDRDEQVVNALRASIGQELAAVGGIPNNRSQFQNDVDFFTAFENMDRGAPPFPPSDILPNDGSFGLSAEDNAIPQDQQSKRARAATVDDESPLDAQDLELLDPEVSPLFSNTLTPPSARNSQGSRTVGLENPPVNGKSSQVRDPLNSRNSDLDQALDLGNMEDDPILSPSPPDGAGKQDSLLDDVRPLTQRPVEDDPIHDDGASTASKPSLNEEMEPRPFGLAQQTASEDPIPNKDEDARKRLDEGLINPHVTCPSEEFDKMAGDNSFAFPAKRPNKPKEGRGKGSSKGDQGRRKPGSEQQLPRDAMVTTRTTRTTDKVLSSDRELEQDVQKRPEADDDSPVPEQEAEPGAEKDDSSDEGEKNEIEDKVEKSEPKKGSTKDGSGKTGLSETGKGDAERDGDEEQVTEEVVVEEVEGKEEEDEKKDDEVKEKSAPKDSKQVSERQKAKSAEVRVMVKDSDDEDEEEVEPVEPERQNDKNRDGKIHKRPPSDDKVKSETAVKAKEQERGETADDEDEEDMITPDPSKTDPSREKRAKKGVAPTSLIAMGEDEDEEDADRVITKDASTKNGTKRSADKSSHLERQTKRSRNDYYMEKLETELQAIREFRRQVDRHPEMFALNPNRFLPGPIRRSVDRSLPSVPPPKVPNADHVAPKSAPI